MPLFPEGVDSLLSLIFILCYLGMVLRVPMILQEKKKIQKQTGTLHFKYIFSPTILKRAVLNHLGIVWLFVAFLELLNSTISQDDCLALYI